MNIKNLHTGLVVVIIVAGCGGEVDSTSLTSAEQVVSTTTSVEVGSEPTSRPSMTLSPSTSSSPTTAADIAVTASTSAPSEGDQLSETGALAAFYEYAELRNKCYGSPATCSESTFEGRATGVLLQQNLSAATTQVKEKVPVEVYDPVAEIERFDAANAAATISFCDYVGDRSSGVTGGLASVDAKYVEGKWIMIDFEVSSEQETPGC